MFGLSTCIIKIKVMGNQFQFGHAGEKVHIIYRLDLDDFLALKFIFPKGGGTNSHQVERNFHRNLCSPEGSSQTRVSSRCRCSSSGGDVLKESDWALIDNAYHGAL